MEQNQTIHSWVNDDLAHFCCPILMAALPPDGSQGCMRQTVPNVGGHKVIIDAHQVCFRFQISCSNSKRERLKGEQGWKFHIYCPSVKTKVRWERCISEKNQASRMTEPPVYIWWVASPWPDYSHALIEKKEEISLTVKLEAFRIIHQLA